MAATPGLSTTLGLHIEVGSEVCAGQPRIAGTRIRVQDIAVLHERLGLSVDEIVSRYPHLTLAGVYSALAYYHDHRAQIDAQMADGQRLVDAMRQLHPSKLPSKLATNE
jgi:uncharacterized protein (DUF433 family)